MNMASERKTPIRRRPPVYRTNGAAAYDIRYTQYQHGTAAPERPPMHRPRKRTAPRKRVKAKLTVAPMAVVGMLVAGLMLLLVLCGYVQLYEASTQVSDLNSQISELQTQNDRLQSTYNEQIDLKAVETKAAELGMHAPSSKQTVYLELSGRDKAEILTTEKQNVFQTMIEAVRSTVQRMVEYFR